MHDLHHDEHDRNRLRADFDDASHRLAELTSTDGKPRPASRDDLDLVRRDLADRWDDRRESELAGGAADRAEITRQIREVWGDALDRLDHLVCLAEGLGGSHQSHHRPNDDLLHSALSSLHARACQVAHEAQWSLTGGYPRAAEARTRTLHELVVTMRILSDHARTDPELVTRFVEHAAVDELRDVRTLAAHHEALGVTPPDPAWVERLDAHVSELADRWPGYRASYGWARPLAKDGTFQEAARLARFDQLHALYQVGNAATHAGADAMHRQTVTRPDGRWRITNATTRGLGFAGVATSRLIAEATTAYVAGDDPPSDAGHLIGVAALKGLAARTADAFAQAHDQNEG